MPLGKRFFDNLVDVILKQTDNQTEGSKVLGEYSINTSINSINLTCFNGSIRWIPLDKEEQPRIEIVKEVRGSNRQEMERILRNLRVEDYSTESEVVLRAVEPRRPIEAKSAVIHYTVYASPEQITRFTGQTSNGKIDIQASFNGYLDLNSSNGSIVLKDGEGIVNLSTLNGSIKFERLILTDSSSVKNSNGTIKGSVVLPQTGEFLFTTLNGLIDLRMPDNTLGDFKLHTSNGKVSFRLGSDNISGRGSIHVRRAEQPVVSIRTLDGKVNVHEE